MRVYLDWNATTPPAEEVLAAMREASERAWANPSSVHEDGRIARAVIEDARAEVGLLTSCDPRDVVFTSGGTEANNLALRSAFETASAEPRVLVTSRLEHPSVARVAEALAAEGRARVHWLRVLPSGVLDLEDLARALDTRGDVGLVAVQAVNHETGVVQPLAEVIRIARDRSRPVDVHVDAVQAWGKVEIPCGFRSATIAAHKIRGPKGIGALVTRPRASVSPLLLGGAQERGLRPGTLSATLAAGFGAAARRARGRSAEYAHIAHLRDSIETTLGDLGGQVAGASSPRAPHVSNVIFEGWSGAELVAAVDLEGVSVSSGAACSAGTVEPSPVLTAMVGEAAARGGVRLSLGDDTTAADVDFARAVFTRVVGRARFR